MYRSDNDDDYRLASCLMLPTTLTFSRPQMTAQPYNLRMQKHCDPYLQLALPLMRLARLILLSALVMTLSNVRAQTTSGDVATLLAPDHEVNNTPKIADSHDSRISDMLLGAMSLIGVRYRYGGNHPEQGFDCSGFVRHLFQSTFSILLPRSSAELGKMGDDIAMPDIQIGDLVFYNTRKRAFSHVGIYIGEGRFIHAPSRGKSVGIVDMRDSYWEKRFNGARRLIRFPAPTPTPSTTTDNDADVAPLSN